MARSSMTVCTERRSVNGGCTDTSSEATSAGVSRSPRSWTVRIDWRWSWCIFQLPLTSGRRASGRRGRPRQPPAAGAFGGVAQGHQAGQVAVLEELERGPAAGRDEARPRSARPELVEGGHRVPAAHHAEARRSADRLGHGAGPGGEAVVLEDPHGPVPEHRPGVGHGVGEGPGASRARCRGPASRRGCRARPSDLALPRRPRRSSRPARGPRRRSGAAIRSPASSSRARQSSTRPSVEQRRPDASGPGRPGR